MRKIISLWILWTCSLTVSAFLFVTTGPILERNLAPILIEQEVTAIARTGDEVCWLWSWTKARDAKPVEFSWVFTVSDTHLQIPAVVLRAQDRRPLTTNSIRPPGYGSVTLCASLGAPLAKAHDVDLIGTAVYQPPHGLWTVWQPTPTINVPDPS